jgi:hypothetical protein
VENLPAIGMLADSRNEHGKTTAPEPHPGILDESGIGRSPRREDDVGAGLAVGRAPQPDSGVAQAPACHGKRAICTTNQGTLLIERRSLTC